ncbi:D-alanyl-D-alanine carboxypeptidase family protein [Microbacterium sp. SS28]|uniref:D-alanyl-D-alanine carboxypeptidase family protein n=1 Tax=Microbacterium sp. SS28 TaxID=2919948 RepID=UPI001FA95B96|nr:D-alanyl-D-alanine carboxypeptidase [Microbacterium sp. SS28]
MDHPADAPAYAPAGIPVQPTDLVDAPAYGSPAPGAIEPGKPGKAHKEPRRPSKDPRIAFAWVDEEAVGRTALAPRDLSAAAASYVAVGGDLLARAPRRSPFRAGVLVPIAIIAALIGAYSGTTLLWPLHSVAPEIEAIQVDSTPSPAAALTWPAQGSGAVAVSGFGGMVASTQDAAPIASITKVVTALLVLEELPLAIGEPGPDYRFTANDRTRYWGYRSRGESALDIPVGGALSEYQMLEGMLIGSANNYADRLASGLWPSDAVYASAARAWLEAHGVPGVTIVEPTGFDARNTASAASLIPLAQKALANPVIAEIVAKTATDLPGASHVTNTNGLLADAGVIGVKTGSLDDFNLLAAKDIMVGESPLRLYAAVLGQPDDAARIEATRALFAQLEADLQTEPSVAAGTTVGVIDTLWGEHVEVKTDADASVVLWNGLAGTVSTDLSLGDDRDTGDTVGALTVKGPHGSSTVDVVLAGDIEPPSSWWRLTHPLELFGLAG